MYVCIYVYIGVSENGKYPNGYLHVYEQRGDDKPMDLGVHYVQTNSKESWCLDMRKNPENSRVIVKASLLSGKLTVCYWK